MKKRPLTVTRMRHKWVPRYAHYTNTHPIHRIHFLFAQTNSPPPPLPPSPFSTLARQTSFFFLSSSSIYTHADTNMGGYLFSGNHIQFKGLKANTTTL